MPRRRERASAKGPANRSPGSPLRDAAAGLGLAAAAAAGAASLAGAVVTVLVARAVVTPPSGSREPVEVHALDRRARTIRLARTRESSAPGQYSIVYAAGQGRARVGEIVREDARTVTRRFGDERGRPLDGIRGVRMVSSPQLEPADVGLPWTSARVQTEVGPMPAWLFPRKGSDDWVVHVHGRGAVMTEPLRAVPLVHAEGWNSLVIAYRNDLGAPSSPRRRYGLGATEWRDVEAAVGYAVEHGARRIVLFGWSMGGAAVLQCALSTAHADRIVGIALESPVISWRETLRLQGDELRLPRVIARAGIALLRSRLAPALTGVEAPLPLADLEILDRAHELRVPVLLMHSTADRVVPHRPSASLARMRPDLVTYEQFSDALHTRLWNVDARRWEGVVTQWFRGLGAGGRSGG